MRKFLTCTAATFVYWIVLILGPAAIMALNDIGYSVSGVGWEEGSIMYGVLSFLKQSVCCLVAYAAARSICGEESPKCVLANCIAGSVICVMLTYSVEINIELFTMATASFVCLGTVIAQMRSIK